MLHPKLNPLATRNAERVAPFFNQYANEVSGDDDQTALADLLGDLRHLAAVRGLDWHEAEGSALTHYTAESNPDDLARDSIREEIDDQLRALGIRAEYGPGIESDASEYDTWTHERADGTLAALIFDGITWTVAEARDAAGFAAEGYTATHTPDPDSDVPAHLFARVVLGE